MNIQKPGRAWGVARTLDGESACDVEEKERNDAYPQKINVSENIRLATVPPVSATSIPAMTMFVNVEVKRRNAKMKRNIKAPCKRFISIKYCFGGPGYRSRLSDPFMKRRTYPLVHRTSGLCISV
jgi:hypothetical protein